jgi:hypothetical protein
MCGARARSLVESFAAGILRRLGDMEDARKKQRRFAASLRVMSNGNADTDEGGAGTGATGAGATAGVSTNPMLAAGAGAGAGAGVTTNPMLAATSARPLAAACPVREDVAAAASAAEGNAKAPLPAGDVPAKPSPRAPPRWRKFEDETDTWFQSVETGEVSWDVPPGAVVVE